MDYAEILFEKAITRYGPEGDHTDRWEWQAGEHIRELESELKRVGERLRYLASSVDPKELEHELHALARECGQ